MATTATITFSKDSALAKISQKELQALFEEFLEEKFGEDITILYEINEEDLPEKSKQKLANFDKLNFVEY